MARTHPLVAELPRLKVAPAVAAVAGPQVERGSRLEAARGKLRLPALDFLTALLALCSDQDAELRREASATVRRLPAERLTPLLARADFPPRLADFLARLRWREPELLDALLASPALAQPTVLFLAGCPEPAVLAALSRLGLAAVDCPGLPEALRANPALTPDLAAHLGLPAVSEPDPAAQDAGASGEEADADDEDASGEEGEEEEKSEELSEEHLSKYQMVLEIGVSDKIKLALTGDKEWRSLLIKDANKLVNAAVVKNPRITEGEVIALARNRAATDEQIRLITLNREWMKNYEIKRALVSHPRTPLPNALRYMSVLTEKDLKALAKSKSVSAVIVNQARRMLLQKKK